MKSVLLSDVEIKIGEYLGKRRMKQSTALQLKACNGAERILDIDVIGALCELAFAKFMNYYPGFTVGTYKANDVADFQVRGTKYLNGRLIVRANDKDTDKFVLVIAKGNGEFVIAGWLSGAEAKRIGRYEAKAGRDSAWWVEQAQLKEFEA